jgi:hypothetical protein
MVKLLLANYEGKWKYDILREIYYMIQILINSYDYILIDTHNYQLNSSIEKVIKNLNFEDITNIMVIENHDEVLIHHVFEDIYAFKDRLFIFADDIHKNSHLKHVNYYENFEKIFVTYKEPFLKDYPEVQKDKVHWIPHGFTDDHKLCFNTKPINKVLVSGKSGSLYPLRRQMIREVSNQKDKITLLTHPNYKKFDYDNLKNLKIGNNFGKVLNAHICCFTDCSSLQYILAKYFEIPASGALLLAEENAYGDLEKLGFIDNVNYIKCTKNNIMNKINWILNPVNINDVDKIRRNGQNHAFNNHHIMHRVKKMVSIMNHNNEIVHYNTHFHDHENYKFYYVFGLTRSGNRALCYWIQNMIKNSIFINDTKQEFMLPSNILKNIVETPSDKLYNDFTVPEFSSDQALIMFYENKKIDEILCNKENFITHESTFIILIRNPYNYLASKFHIFKKKRLPNKELVNNLIKDIQMWKNYYIECFAYPDNVVVYDEWIINSDYRKKICTKLKLNNDDTNIFKVNGQGASLFDKNEIIDVQSVLNRYKIYSENNVYKTHVIDNSELKIMWNSILNVFCSSLKSTYNVMFETQIENIKYEINYYNE